MNNRYQKLFEQVRQLTCVTAVSGHENRLSQLLAGQLKPLADQVVVDRLLNVQATFLGAADPEQSIVLFAHMDEIGLMVSKVEPNGLLRFERVGGTAEKTLPSQRVDVFTLDDERALPGVVGAVSHHYASDAQKHNVPARADMYIDVGAQSAAEVVEMGLDVGSVVGYAPHCEMLGGRRVCAKTLDNRLAVLMLLEAAAALAQRRPQITVHIVLSVQEEFSVRGVTPVFERLRPDKALCIDVSPACDVPDLHGLNDIGLGKGPVITHMNAYGKGPFGGLVPNRELRRLLEQAAGESRLAFQREVITNLVTDAAFVQYMGPLGVATAHLSIPVRYTHAPTEVADLQDLDQCIALLNSFVYLLR